MLGVLETCSIFAATGHTAAWVVYSVSQHPEVEAKLVEQLKSLDLLATAEQPAPRPIQWDDIPRLTYLNAVIKVCAAATQPMTTWQHVSRVICNAQMLPL